MPHHPRNPCRIFTGLQHQRGEGMSGDDRPDQRDDRGPAPRPADERCRAAGPGPGRWLERRQPAFGPGGDGPLVALGVGCFTIIVTPAIRPDDILTPVE
jgi:hypothetical protein